jgi:hypothetical protein
VALAGFFGYRNQKSADRKHELIQRKQQIYEHYLTAFRHASYWNYSPEEKKGLSPEEIDYVQSKHAEAQFVYHDSHLMMLLVASDEVMETTNAFHRYYVETPRIEWREAKRLYAEMVHAMRKDGFEESRFTVEELAGQIPWTIGNEPEEREALRRTEQQQLPGSE